MKLTLVTEDLKKQDTDAVIIGIYDKSELTPAAKILNKLTRGHLQKLLENETFQTRVGQTLLFRSIPNVSFSHVLLVGCGNRDTPLSAREYFRIVTSSIRCLQTSKIIRARSFLTELHVEKHTLPWKIKQAVLAMREAEYVFDLYKTTREPKTALKEVSLFIPGEASFAACQKVLLQASSISNGVEYTKNLANMPGNICTPTFLATTTKKLAKEYKSLSVKILEESDMKKLGMNAFLAVAKGSLEDAKLICIEYKGTKKKQRPVALVGKGITFDTGGISLKHADGMVGMKYDMCGAATVLGVMKAVAELKLPIHLVGIIASAENMPGGSASKPEDIVVSLSGQTIEIMNTDAEGRLVLCDALTYCERYKPDTVIDIATLTGAVVIALGHHATAVLSNNDTLASHLVTAGIDCHDRVWQMPLWEEYQDQLKSPFADMSNVGGRTGGVITAACFLSRFAKKFHWAHLDVAGTAAMMGVTERFATGRPVPLLVQYLINRCGTKTHAKN